MSIPLEELVEEDCRIFLLGDCLLIFKVIIKVRDFRITEYKDILVRQTLIGEAMTSLNSGNT